MRFRPQVTSPEHALAKYALELALLDYEMSWVRPSEQAASALCLSLKVLGDGRWGPTLAYYGRYAEQDLVPTMARMAGLMVMSPRSPYTVRPRIFFSPTQHCTVLFVPPLR